MSAVATPTLKTPTRADTYQIVTDRISARLAQGVVPWRQPWRASTTMPKNLVSMKAYRGINVFMLASAGYASPYWLSFKQAQDLGASVKRGEKGMPVVFWKLFTPGEDAALPEGAQRRIPLARYSTVFNAEQCEGWSEKLQSLLRPADTRPFDPISECAKVLAGYKNAPEVTHGGGQACYIPVLDKVRMPEPESFVSRELYYSVLFHELGHSTGHDKRLARKGVTDPVRFGSHTYSQEELVAEMTAAFLSGVTGIDGATLDDSSSYIAHWLKALRGDPKMLVLAASQAQKAADMILEVTPKATSEEGGSSNE